MAGSIDIHYTSPYPNESCSVFGCLKGGEHERRFQQRLGTHTEPAQRTAVDDAMHNRTWGLPHYGMEENNRFPDYKHRPYTSPSQTMTQPPTTPTWQERWAEHMAEEKISDWQRRLMMELPVLDRMPCPGSDYAMLMGCKCDIMENRGGYGRSKEFPYNGGMFRVDWNCPIHKTTAGVFCKMPE